MQLDRDKRLCIGEMTVVFSGRQQVGSGGQ